jgi:hypothetical protein
MIIAVTNMLALALDVRAATAACRGPLTEYLVRALGKLA